MKLLGFVKEEMEFTAIVFLIATGIIATVATVVFGLYQFPYTFNTILP